MIEPELLKILCCPENHQPLRLAEAGLVSVLNQRIAAGGVSNRAGSPVREPIEGGLVRADGQWLYPIRGHVPVLLIGEALPLAGSDA